jgi:hypothetical protein
MKFSKASFKHTLPLPKYAWSRTEVPGAADQFPNTSRIDAAECTRYQISGRVLRRYNCTACEKLRSHQNGYDHKRHQNSLELRISPMRFSTVLGLPSFSPVARRQFDKQHEPLQPGAHSGLNGVSTSPPCADQTTGKSHGGRLSSRYYRLLLLGVAPFYLYLNLFTFSNTPYLRGGDQTAFWAVALRMLQGEFAYRDFFQFTPPGTDLFYFGLFRIFGPSIWVTDLAIIILGTALCWVCFETALQIMDRAWAVLSAGLFLVFVYGRLLDATHHWFSLLAIVCALKILMPQRTFFRVAVAGTFLGTASFFTQTSGVLCLLGLASALVWEHFYGERPWRTVIELQLLLVAFFVLTWGVASAYFIVIVGWKQLWYQWVVYAGHNVAYSHQLFLPGATPGAGPHSATIVVQRVLVYALTLLVYPLVCWRCWYKRHDPAFQNGMQLVLLSLPGFFLMLAATSRPNWNRIYMVSMPAFILFVWGLAAINGPRKNLRAIIWAVVAFSGLRQTVSMHQRPTIAIELPAGRTVLVDDRYNDEFLWIAHHTKPGDVFLQATWMNTYFPLKLQSPVFVDGLWPNQLTPPEFVELTIRQTERRQVKYILWSPRFTDPAAHTQDGPDSLGPFRTYLVSHYTRIQVFLNQDEIWQRQ